jgi:hypothetical protein
MRNSKDSVNPYGLLAEQDKVQFVLLLQLLNASIQRRYPSTSLRYVRVKCDTNLLTAGPTARKVTDGMRYSIVSMCTKVTILQDTAIVNMGVPCLYMIDNLFECS